MAFFRPEARAAIWRWREALAGAVIALFGLFMAIGARGLDPWLGLAVAFAGAALGWAGFQLGRFRRARGGPGVVQVDERRIAYFGPFGGGFVALGGLRRLEIVPPRAGGHPAWRLHHEGGEALEIPADAEGAEALFDVFAALPGLRIEPMLQALENPPDQAAVIWESEEDQGALRLH